MAPQAPQPELSFVDRLKAREHALSWLCHDGGLAAFMYPANSSAPSVSPEARRAHVTTVLHAYLADASEPGRAALARVQTRAAAATLRQLAARLRTGDFTHRDLAKMAVVLDTLWDDANSNLDDVAWARCSMRFDTALITLRVSYVLAYMAAAAPPQRDAVAVRKAIYTRLIERLFSADTPAPVDDPANKHSRNFKSLLDVWRNELMAYLDNPRFNEKLARLERLQKPADTATYVVRFIDQLGEGPPWLQRALRTDADIAAGVLTSKAGRKAAAVKKKKTSKPALPEPEPEDLSSSSFEPAAHDSDYSADPRVGSNDEDDDEDYREVLIDSPDNRRSGRRRSRPMRFDPELVRRSQRVARSNIRHRQKSGNRSRRNPERFADLEYRSGSSLPVRPSDSEMRRRMSGLDDDEPGSQLRKHVGGLGVEEEILNGDDGDAHPVPLVTRRKRGRQPKAATPVREKRRRRVIHDDEDDDRPLRESGFSGDVKRLSERLNPESQAFEATGLSDIDEVTANVVRKRRLLRALKGVDVKVRSDMDEDDLEVEIEDEEIVP